MRFFLILIFYLYVLNFRIKHVSQANVTDVTCDRTRIDARAIGAWFNSTLSAALALCHVALLGEPRSGCHLVHFIEKFQ